MQIIPKVFSPICHQFQVQLTKNESFLRITSEQLTALTDAMANKDILRYLDHQFCSLSCEKPWHTLGRFTANPQSLFVIR